MTRNVPVLLVCLVITLFFAFEALAHTPLCACADEGDGTILCEGGFSDGASGEGVNMQVLDADGKVLIEGKMNEDSEFQFKKPKGEYTVIYDAGPAHDVKVPSSEITE